MIVKAAGGNNIINASSLTIPVTLDGGDGDDVMTGGLAPDIIISGAGKDTVTAQPGDNLDLGAGQDGIIINGTSRRRPDLLHPRHATARPLNPSVNFNANQFILDYHNGETITLHGGGDDSIQAHDTNGWITSLFGDDGDDLIVGDGGNGSITGGGGKDTIDGRGGSDSIFARDGEVDHIFFDVLDAIRKDDKDRVYK
ncbi:MAG: hypothetical protein QM767_01860 [Anaeromyxobacter sp.]